MADGKRFEVKPERFVERVESLLGHVGSERKELIEGLAVIEAVVEEVVVLCGGLFTPRFKMATDINAN